MLADLKPDRKAVRHRRPAVPAVKRRLTKNTTTRRSRPLVVSSKRTDLRSLREADNADVA